MIHFKEIQPSNVSGRHYECYDAIGLLIGTIRNLTDSYYFVPASSIQLWLSPHDMCDIIKMIYVLNQEFKEHIASIKSSGLV